MKASLFDLFSSALSTKAIILETVLSPKFFVVRTRMTPVKLIHPETTSSPSFKSRGTLSPVSAKVFKAELPSTTTPSKGTFSPGRTTMTSPTFTSSGETVSTRLFLSTFATSGRISIKWEMLSRLFPSAYPSKSSPTWKKSITNTASGNSVSESGKNPMQRAPMVAIAIKKSSSNTSPWAMPSAASIKVSCPIIK